MIQRQIFFSFMTVSWFCLLFSQRQTFALRRQYGTSQLLSQKYKHLVIIKDVEIYVLFRRQTTTIELCQFFPKLFLAKFSLSSTFVQDSPRLSNNQCNNISVVFFENFSADSNNESVCMCYCLISLLNNNISNLFKSSSGGYK